LNSSRNSARPSGPVAIFIDERCNYTSRSPYHPSQHYPEYPFGEENVNKRYHGDGNAYNAVRELLHLMRLDEENYGLPSWNPLGRYIKPNQNVVIKPNFVLHINQSGDDLYASITHPSVLRAIADYCFIALKGTGSLAIVDAPQMDCDFSQLEQLMRLRDLSEFYRTTAGFELPILDIRRLRCSFDLEKGYYPAESFIVNDNADPLGTAIIDLGEDSYLNSLPNLHHLYGADFDRRFTAENHSRGVHKYCISKTVLNADTVICVPKMKTHKKVGVTLNMKLLVGINVDKNYLAHFRVGTPQQGGDEFPVSEKRNVAAVRKFRRILNDHLFVRRKPALDKAYLAARAIGSPILKFLREKNVISAPSEVDTIGGGNWHGNDTAWRMAADLARILLYANKQGVMCNEPQRTVVSIVDGIIGGEGDGPLSPIPKHVGTLIGGDDILAVDIATATYMGFDYRKLRMLYEPLQDKGSRWRLNNADPDSTIVLSNDVSLNKSTIATCYRHRFLPHRHWKGHIELENLSTMSKG